jgi:hypothetical protein
LVRALQLDEEVAARRVDGVRGRISQDEEEIGSPTCLRVVEVDPEKASEGRLDLTIAPVGVEVIRQYPGVSLQNSMRLYFVLLVV